MIRQKDNNMDNNNMDNNNMDNNESFFTKVDFGILLTHRYFQEIVPSTGADLGVLMLHQGSEYDERLKTITLQPKRARIARVSRPVRDHTGAFKAVVGSPKSIRPGTLIKFGAQPHNFDLSNLRPVGSPLATPLPVLDATLYSEAKAHHGLARKAAAMQRLQDAMSGAAPKKEEAGEALAETCFQVEADIWAYRSEDGTWTILDGAARWEPVMGLSNMEEAKAAAQLQLEQLGN